MAERGRSGAFSNRRSEDGGGARSVRYGFSKAFLTEDSDGGRVTRNVGDGRCDVAEGVFDMKSRNS